jgi:hypothetical protein
MNFMGLTGFHWFTGVVEDRMDPLEQGRVRVRIFGLHSEEKITNDSTGQGIPTNDLPWAWPMSPITSASMDGIGATPLGPVEGTWVVGFARDGEVMNDLVYIGTIGGKPVDPPADKKGKIGFVDPRTAGEIAESPRFINEEENLDPGYPPKSIPQGRYPQEKWLDESHVNRLARGAKLDETLLKPKKEKRIQGIPTGISGTWSEKASPYGAKYPYNKVFESEAGHVVEFDDTKGKERIHIWFNGKDGKGSYVEFHPDGSIQVKAQGDYYDISVKDRRIYAKQDVSITAKENVKVFSEKGGVDISTAIGSINVKALVGGFNVTTVLPINMISATSVGITSPIINATAPIINLNTELLTINGITFYTA